MSIKHEYQFIKISLDVINCIEADGSYTTLVIGQHRYALRLTISHVLDRLSFPRLIRVHRSYAVNLNRVSTFNEREVCLPTLSLPLGRLDKPDFLRHFDIGESYAYRSVHFFAVARYQQSGPNPAAN